MDANSPDHAALLLEGAKAQRELDAAAAQRDLRSLALERAIMAEGPAAGPEGIVAAAKIFEQYLRGE